MAARDFQDLLAWQLSYELKCEVVAFTGTGRAAKDFKYCDQIRASSASAPSNISEGFGRFRPGDFARFLEFARGSLMETQNHLIDGRDRGYMDTALYSRLVHLCRAALKTTTALLREKQRQAAADALERKRHRQR
jgi:four helix bundle protein